jgi:hypothetical protein
MLFFIVVSSHYADSFIFPQISFSSSEPEPDYQHQPEPEPEPEPEYDPEPEYTPAPKRRRKYKSTTPAPEPESEPDVKIRAPGLTFKFDVPGIKIKVPAIHLPGVSIKTSLKKAPFALRLFPLNVKLPRLKLETGLGGQFGISSGGKGGFGISTE